MTKVKERIKKTRKRTTYQTRQTSLFVGRWQPFHRGHKKLIETVLKKNKPVTIAIRDTEINQDNPYTLQERWTMIQHALHKYGDLVKIVVIPDIDEICYGRDVGYVIRRIELEPKINKISGTTIRTKYRVTEPIIWLTGQTGSGKTTIANVLQKKIGGVILDGNEMRKSISVGLGFSKQDREEHNLRVARLAVALSRKNIVIVSVIAPFEETRKKIDEIAKPIWVYVERDVKITREKPYEIPKTYSIKVNSDHLTPQKQVDIILQYLKKKQIINLWRKRNFLQN